VRETNHIRAEACAAALLQRFGIDAPGYDVEDIAAALKIEVVEGGLTSADAWIVRYPDGTGTIRLNARVTIPGRRRFSIAHELGHWEMHPAVCQGFLCTAKDFRDYSRSPDEIEANCFAGCLLIPRQMIPTDLLRRDPEFAVVDDLARQFGATRTASARRLTDLTKHAVVLVCSTNGVVSWIQMSTRGRGFFIQPGTPVPQHSVTFELVSKKEASSKVESVEPETWFPARQFSDDFELFEEVRYSEEFNSALTLLWLPAAE
jgi:hypothetical protein